MLCVMDSEEALKEACSVITDKRKEVVIALLEMLLDREIDIGKVAGILIKGLDSKEAEVRWRTLEVLIGQSSGELVQKFLELVKDPEEPVRVAAIEALKWAKDRTAIEQLIDWLETEEPPARDYVAEALKALTLKDFGTDHGAWKEWWGKNEKTAPLAQPPRKYTPAPTGKGTTTYYGEPVTSKNVIFLIDISSSMSEEYISKGKLINGKGKGTTPDPDPDPKKGTVKKVTKIEVAKKELIRCIMKLSNDVKFNIIFYSDDFSPWQRDKKGQGSKIVPASRWNKRIAIDFVRKFQPMAKTNISDTLEFALSDKDADTIYLLTDGMPTVGRYLETDEIVAMVRRRNKQRDPKAVINTIGFGLRPRGKGFLKQLADENKGVFIDM